MVRLALVTLTLFGLVTTNVTVPVVTLAGILKVRLVPSGLTNRLSTGVPPAVLMVTLAPRKFVPLIRTNVPFCPRVIPLGSALAVAVIVGAAEATNVNGV